MNFVFKKADLEISLKINLARTSLIYQFNDDLLWVINFLNIKTVDEIFGSFFKFS